MSASTPGVVFENLLIIGSTVPEALPSAPGDIRAYDVKTGALRWSFHTIPHPGEPGYETWPPDAWKIAGGVNAWSGVTVDARRAMVKANKAIRCWVMPHWRVSESLPSELALFDLVIVDEASQSGPDQKTAQRETFRNLVNTESGEERPFCGIH